MANLFCPYCGDEVSNESEIKAQEEYFKDHNTCTHWDNRNIEDEC